MSDTVEPKTSDTSKDSSQSRGEKRKGNMSAKGTQQGEKRRKKIKPFRITTHRNPLAHGYDLVYPLKPGEFNSADLYGKEIVERGAVVDVADVGCGFGDFLLRLGELYGQDGQGPHANSDDPRLSLTLGMEIRTSAVEYVREQIEQKRTDNPSDERYSRVAVVHSNAMKHFTKYFEKGQLRSIFFLFPDPHFKKKMFRRRIINTVLLSQYAYALKVGGRLYCATDVPALHEWHVKHLEAHPLFERIPNEEFENDPIIEAVLNSSHEARKVEREGRSDDKNFAVYRRVAECLAMPEPIAALATKTTTAPSS